MLQGLGSLFQLSHDSCHGLMQRRHFSVKAPILPSVWEKKFSQFLIIDFCILLVRTELNFMIVSGNYHTEKDCIKVIGISHTPIVQALCSYSPRSPQDTLWMGEQSCPLAPKVPSTLYSLLRKVPWSGGLGGALPASHGPAVTAYSVFPTRSVHSSTKLNSTLSPSLAPTRMDFMYSLLDQRCTYLFKICVCSGKFIVLPFTDHNLYKWYCTIHLILFLTLSLSVVFKM